MIAHKGRKNLIIKTIIYLYSFLVIYMPRISDLLINIPIEVFSIGILISMIIPWFLICKKGLGNMKIKKNMFFLISGILVSSVYFAIRAAIGTNEVRLFQNLFIIIQILHIVIIIDFMKVIEYESDDMIKVLFRLGLIQGVICILMLIFPQFKKIALNLYYLGREENIFISRMRIYGISGDYTFFTPIYHGILAVVAFFHTVFKDKKYFIYIPFILIAIILNGRFGLIIFILGIVLGPAYLLIKGKMSIRMIKFINLAIIILVSGVFILFIVSPYTFKWIFGGVVDTLNLITGKGKTGNYVALADSMLYLPRGFGILFGEGHRVYSFHGTSRGYNASDIGYVNDLFMGGLLYITILYGTLIKFILRKSNSDLPNDKAQIYINSIVPLFLMIALLVSNYKGEVMRGGTVLVGVIFIKLILSSQVEGINRKTKY